MASSPIRKSIMVSYVERHRSGSGDEDEFVQVEGTQVEDIGFEQIPYGHAGASTTQDGIPRTFDGFLESCCETFGLDYDDIFDGQTPALYRKNADIPNLYARVRSLDFLKDGALYHFCLEPDVVSKKKDAKTKRKTNTATTASAAKKAKRKVKAKKTVQKPKQKQAKPTTGKRQKSASRRTTLNSGGRPQRKREAPDRFALTVDDLNDSDVEQLSIPPRSKKRATTPTPRGKRTSEESDSEDNTRRTKKNKLKELEKMTRAIYRQLFNYPIGSLLAVELYEGFFYEGKITSLHRQGWVMIRFKYIPGGTESKWYDLRRWRHWVIKSGDEDDDDDEDSEVGLERSKFIMVPRNDGEEMKNGSSMQIIAKRRVQDAGRGNLPDLEDSVRVFWSHIDSLTKKVECPPTRYDGCITDLCWVGISGAWYRFVHVQYIAGKDECWSLPEVFLRNPELQGPLPQDTAAAPNVISPSVQRQLNSNDVDRGDGHEERINQIDPKEEHESGGNSRADGMEEDHYYDADDGNLQSIVI